MELESADGEGGFLYANPALPTFPSRWVSLRPLSVCMLSRNCIQGVLRPGVFFFPSSSSAAAAAPKTATTVCMYISSYGRPPPVIYVSIRSAGGGGEGEGSVI